MTTPEQLRYWANGIENENPRKSPSNSEIIAALEAYADMIEDVKKLANKYGD